LYDVTIFYHRNQKIGKFDAAEKNVVRTL